MGWASARHRTLPLTTQGPLPAAAQLTAQLDAHVRETARVTDLVLQEAGPDGGVLTNSQAVQ